MRAWQVHRHGTPRHALALADVPEPVPGPGEIRLRVGAAAIGLPDVLMCGGTYPLTPALPFVPGQEVCGVVDAVGEGVELARATRVMAVTSFVDGRGGFAEATIAHAANAYRVPDEMTDVEAAGFRIAGSTAWIGLVRRGGLHAGDRLLVLGAAGGSGSAAVQLGRALGAQVIAVGSGAARLAWCERIGADVTVDRSNSSWPDDVLAATGGRGVDIVFDPVGGVVASTAVRLLAPGGRLLAVGFASGEWAQPSTADLVRRNASLVGVYASGFARDESEADHEALLALAGADGLGGAPTVVPFARLPEGVESVADARTTGKVVVQVGNGSI